VAEALAAGLPVIVSDQVAIAEEVAAAGAGTVVPLDVELWTAELRRLLRAPDERAERGMRATRLARERYSWEMTARRLLALYAEVTSGRAARERSA
jgi:glycosyltransferase involved in cell wall biosynthesis